MQFFDILAGILNTAYTLFCFMLGFWAGVVYLRNGKLGGEYWGALWTCTLLAVAILAVWLLRTLAGEQLRWVYLLYCLFFIIALPGTFAIMRGRDDRFAAGIFAGVATFAALASISAADPRRGVVSPPLVTPTVVPAASPTQKSG